MCSEGGGRDRRGRDGGAVARVSEIARDESRDYLGAVARVGFSGPREERSPVSEEVQGAGRGDH